MTRTFAARLFLPEIKKGQPPRWGLTIASAQRRQHSVCPLSFRARGRGAWAELLPGPTPLRRSTTRRARPARPPYLLPKIKKGQPPGRETGVLRRSGQAPAWASPCFPRLAPSGVTLFPAADRRANSTGRRTREGVRPPPLHSGVLPHLSGRSLYRVFLQGLLPSVRKRPWPSSHPLRLEVAVWCAECSAHFQDLPLGAVRGVIPRVTSYHLPFSARFMLLFCPALFRARASRVRASVAEKLRRCSSSVAPDLSVSCDTEK